MVDNEWSYDTFQNPDIRSALSNLKQTYLHPWTIDNIITSIWRLIQSEAKNEIINCYQIEMDAIFSSIVYLLTII